MSHQGAIRDVVDPLVIGHRIGPLGNEGRAVLRHTGQFVWRLGWECCEQPLALLLVRRINEDEGHHICRVPLLVVPDRQPSE